MTSASEISNYKYHSAQVVALSSGQLAMVGPFSNEDGLPLIEVFDDFQSLHAALWEYQNRPWTCKYEVSKPQGKISLESLGLVKPMKRRNLNGPEDYR